MKKRELAKKYKELVNQGKQEEATVLVLLEWSRRVMAVMTARKVSQDLAYEITNKIGNQWVDSFRLDIPHDFVLTYLRNEKVMKARDKFVESKKANEGTEV